MLQINSTNCSPIKPRYNQNFGRSEVLTATVDWLEDVDGTNLNEGNFSGLNRLSDKMHDGPLKTFAKILGIGGAAFFAGKAGASKAVNKLVDNRIISKNIATPFAKYLDGAMKSAKKALKANPHFGEEAKGFKSIVVNSLVKGIDELEKFGKKGSHELIENIESKIQSLKESMQGATKAEIKKATDNLIQRKKYAPTENLIKKITTNTAGLGAGTVAVVEANKDRDKNGIADIGERR